MADEPSDSHLPIFDHLPAFFSAAINAQHIAIAEPANHHPTSSSSSRTCKLSPAENGCDCHSHAPPLQRGAASPCAGLSLDTVRDFLTREEDTIVFSLIERAKYPLNWPVYDPAYLGAGAGRLNASFAELFVRESEAVQSKEQFIHPLHIPISLCFLV
ncbi:uncharacterized protein LOC133898606 [Phragmites australis]|uniref:uncharacterized protein LOC133898606 n=1 Tax=Phragmites australis TaxID=29695 RepID=UPI002D774DBB|nr:uncharacterized protein LOC133898606 [Phragmites australis]